MLKSSNFQQYDGYVNLKLSFLERTLDLMSDLSLERSLRVHCEIYWSLYHDLEMNSWTLFLPLIFVVHKWISLDELYKLIKFFPSNFEFLN